MHGSTTKRSYAARLLVRGKSCHPAVRCSSPAQDVHSLVKYEHPVLLSKKEAYVKRKGLAKLNADTPGGASEHDHSSSALKVEVINSITAPRETTNGAARTLSGVGTLRFAAACAIVRPWSAPRRRAGCSGGVSAPSPTGTAHAFPYTGTSGAQAWIQYVSTAPSTRQEVKALQRNFDKRLQAEQVRITPHPSADHLPHSQLSYGTLPPVLSLGERCRAPVVHRNVPRSRKHGACGDGRVGRSPDPRQARWPPCGRTV